MFMKMSQLAREGRSKILSLLGRADITHMRIPPIVWNSLMSMAGMK